MGSKAPLAAGAAVLAMTVTAAPARAATPAHAATRAHHLAQRESGEMTYYNLGMTSCGVAFTDNDLVAAIAFSWWTAANPNQDPLCGKSIRITDPQTGKSLVVRVEDKCSGCQRGDVDVSPAAFQQFRDLGVGRFPVTWQFQ